VGDIRNARRSDESARTLCEGSCWRNRGGQESTRRVDSV